MKKIYLYLLIFSVLINVFTYMYFTKKAKFESEKEQKKEQKTVSKQTIIDSLETKIFDMSNFTLSGNYSAQDYIEKYFEGHDIEKVRDSILNLNLVKGGNKLVGYDSPEDPYIISRLEFLNHKWILADFDNKGLGGQLLIRYSLNNNGTFDLEVVDRAMYLPKPTYGNN